jgi:hypothetical protein
MIVSRRIANGIKILYIVQQSSVNIQHVQLLLMNVNMMSLKLIISK